MTPLPDILGWPSGSLSGSRFDVSVFCVALEVIRDNVCCRRCWIFVKRIVLRQEECSFRGVNE